MLGLNNTNNILNYFKRLSFGGINYDIRIDVFNRTVTFTWADGSGNFKTQTVNYYTVSSGISFPRPS